MSKDYLVHRLVGTAPSAEQVANALRGLGGQGNALDLCNALVLEGHSTKSSQLAMQRAADSGSIAIMPDWTYALPKA